MLSTDSFFDAARANAQAGDELAVMRVSLGPVGYDYGFTGYDMVLLINLTDQSLDDPLFGIVENGSDPTFLKSLLVGGFANDPLFGGSGRVALDALDPFGIYAMLVPDWGTLFNFGFDGDVTSDVAIENNQVAFSDGSIYDLPYVSAIPEPGSLAVLSVGLLGLLGLRRRRRERA